MKEKILTTLIISTLITSTILITTTRATAQEFPAQLAYFPYFFQENGKLNVHIVVGEEANTRDVISATEIAVFMQGVFPKERIPSAELDKDYESIEGTNIISIGSPCENYVSALIAGTSNCKEYLPEEGGVVELHEKNGKIAILIAGLTPEETYKATLALIKKRNEMMGKAYIITGTKENPTIKPRKTPKTDGIIKRPEKRTKDAKEELTEKTEKENITSKEEAKERTKNDTITKEVTKEETPKEKTTERTKTEEETTEKEVKHAKTKIIIATLLIITLIIITTLLFLRRKKQEYEEEPEVPSPENA